MQRVAYPSFFHQPHQSWLWFPFVLPLLCSLGPCVTTQAGSPPTAPPPTPIIAVVPSRLTSPLLCPRSMHYNPRRDVVRQHLWPHQSWLRFPYISSVHYNPINVTSVVCHCPHQILGDDSVATSDKGPAGRE